MRGRKIAIASGILLSSVMVLITSGCVVESREGYYDREHHRYWHEHAWHECFERDEHCVEARGR